MIEIYASVVERSLFTEETKQPGAADKSAHVRPNKCPAAGGRSRLTRGAEDIWAAGRLGARLTKNICDSRRTSIFTEKASNLVARINRRTSDQINAQRLGNVRVAPGGGRFLAPLINWRALDPKIRNGRGAPVFVFLGTKQSYAVRKSAHVLPNKSPTSEKRSVFSRQPSYLTQMAQVFAGPKWPKF